MIRREEAIVYKSTLSGRRYFTLKAAMRNEAKAILENYIPSYSGELGDSGIYVSPPEGWGYGLSDEEIDAVIDAVVGEIVKKEIYDEKKQGDILVSIYDRLT